MLTIELLEPREAPSALSAEIQQSLSQLGFTTPTAQATPANVAQASQILITAIEQVPAKVSQIIAKDNQLASQTGFDPSALLPLLGGQIGVEADLVSLDIDLFAAVNDVGLPGYPAAGPAVQQEALGVVLSPSFEGGFPGFGQLMAL